MSDWNNAAKTTIEVALGYVPGAGGILSGLVSIFWPSGQDVWAAIRDQVEALVNQKISELVYQQVSDDLAGLHNVINDYLDTLTTKDNDRITAAWTSAQQIFDYSLPHFQSKGYEVLLLPLLAGFGNLYFSLLRDGVLFGAGWGWNPASLQQLQTKLTSILADILAYVQDTFAAGKQNASNMAGTDLRTIQPWRGINAYVRETTISVLDYSLFWPYFDPSKYPNPVQISLTRELFSDPYGTIDHGTFNPPGAGGRTIATITVWGWDRIDALKVDYTDGSSTGRMGDAGGGSNQPPAGGTYQVSATDPFTVANPWTGDIVNALQLFTRSGWNTGRLAGFYPGGTMFDARLSGEFITSIHINGTSSFYGSADCIVFGFRVAATTDRTLAGLATLFISSPVIQRDVATFLTQIGVKDEALLSAAVQRAKAEHWEVRQKGFREARRLELSIAQRKITVRKEEAKYKAEHKLQAEQKVRAAH